MLEWSVSIDATSGSGFGESEAESIIEVLASHGPVVSYGHGEVTARFSVESDSALEAIKQAIAAFSTTSLGRNVFRVEAQPVEGVEREPSLAAS